ncbi:MAG: hypothetical protein JWR72_2842 [Flavisolibacter sp.]|nr:hypothetical protein [Flavisolibacter sp.]
MFTMTLFLLTSFYTTMKRPLRRFIAAALHENCFLAGCVVCHPEAGGIFELNCKRLL